MKNHELLDIIGEVSGDYVLAADDHAARPRFRWKGWVAAAACVALIVAAYPASRTFSRRQADSAPEQNEEAASADALIESPGLHPYTLIEENIRLTATQGDAQAPAGDAPALMPEPPMPEPGDPASVSGGTYGGAVEGGTDGGADDASHKAAPAQDAVSAQDEASAQYERLLQSLGLWGIDPQGLYPDWCGGIWLDGELLSVAIVDGFHTPGLEAQVKGWCGGTGEILFPDVKYSQNHLDGLMEEISQVFEELDCRIPSAYGVYVMDNCLGLDFFGEAPGDEVLSALARLDPEGDAIRIQVFIDRHIGFTEGSERDPAPEEPAQSAVCAPTQSAAEPTPTPVEGLPDYDILVGADE